MENISQRIKKLRLDANLTQKEFGAIFGIVKSTVSLYESGKSTPDDELKKRIAKHFNVSLDYLMGISDIKNPYENKGENNEITTKAYHNLDVEGLPDEAIRQVEEYIEFLKQKYNSDGALKKKDSK